MRVLIGRTFVALLFSMVVLGTVGAPCALAGDSASAPVTDYDGITYPTVVIGSQTWMAQNLRVTRYTDGTGVESFVYDNDTANTSTYGRLYTWEMALRSEIGSAHDTATIQGVCPCGWHIPTEVDWHQLIDYFGGDSVAGDKLKAEEFGAVSAGWYDFTGAYEGLGEVTFFMMAEAGSRGGIKALQVAAKGASVKKVNLHPKDAISVRCVKD
jgi:uncharacterized protein (TIGR02145 family)